jgi:ABC-type transport system involved in cytochrome c biogenesis permease component
MLEMRQQYSLYGVMLYVASTIFVLYLAIEDPNAATWNALFWITQLFVCINAVAKSFLQEGSGRMLYFYSITSAQNFVLAKLIFNLVLMLAMSLLSLAVFTLLLGNPLSQVYETRPVAVRVTFAFSQTVMSEPAFARAAAVPPIVTICWKIQPLLSFTFMVSLPATKPLNNAVLEYNPAFNAYS